MTPETMSQYRFVRAITGFTLLELLIAMSLSAVLVTVLVAGFNQISREWRKDGDQLETQIDESLLILQLEKAILGTYPYRFKKKNLSKQQLFFEGEKKQLTLVSTVSPNRGSSLTVWHLEAGEEAGLKFTVQPMMPGDVEAHVDKKQQQSEPTTLFTDYNISFEYLAESSNKKKLWNSRWSAKTEDAFPYGVKIQFEHIDHEDDSRNFAIFSFIRAGTKSTGSGNVFFGGDKGIDSGAPNEDGPKVTNPFEAILK